MIKDMLTDSSLRVFNVDRECYVIFVGNGINARDSFLRVGHSAAIPEQAHDRIQGLVCTHDLLGDIVVEREWLSGLTQRVRPYFSGTPEVLKRYKDFFALKKVLGTKYERVKAAPTKDHGSFLYYTDKDQIEVMVEGEPVFSLRKRAAADLHFHQRNEQIVRAIAQYSDVYNASTLPRNGFFVAQSQLYICNRGQLFVVDPSADCYAQLAARGFDSRLISGGVHTQLNQSFLSILMNRTLKYRLSQWHFHASDQSITAAAVESFSKFAQRSITANILKDQFRIPFPTFTLEREREAGPYSLRFSDALQCAIDIRRGMWTVTEGGQRWEGEIIPDIPYSFSSVRMPSFDGLLRRYLPSVFRDGAHGCARYETVLLNACIRFLGVQTARKMALQYKVIRRAARGMGKSMQQMTLYALHNIRALLELQSAQYAQQGGQLSLVRKALKVAKDIMQRAAPSVTLVPYLPAQATIYRHPSEGFMQFVDYEWSRDYRYVEHDTDIQRRILNAMDGGGEDFYRAERSRFFAISCGDGGRYGRRTRSVGHGEGD